VPPWWDSGFTVVALKSHRGGTETPSLHPLPSRARTFILYMGRVGTFAYFVMFTKNGKKSDEKFCRVANNL